MQDFNELKQLMAENRSIRRFDASRPIEKETLEQLIGLTRLCSSARNLQALRYKIIHKPEECAEVFPLLKWAGYLPEWPGPSEAERPVAYLVQCLDTSITANCLCDDGLQLEAITLGATALGIGSCIIKSFNIAQIVSNLKLPEHLKPLYVLALGYPHENVRLVDTDGSHDAEVRYYREADGTHVVPKRPLSELIVK